MKYLRLFEDFDSYDPYELMIIPPNKKAKMIMDEIKKSESNLNLIQDLITFGANIDWKNEVNHGWTPLHYTARYKSVEIAEMLIDAGADLTVQDNQSRTPLHMAAYQGQLIIVQMLIDAGADVYVQDQWNQTPLHYAAVYSEVEIARILIDAGMDLNVQDEDVLHLCT
jgi:ankyrin repeat protein